MPGRTKPSQMKQGAWRGRYYKQSVSNAAFLSYQPDFFTVLTRTCCNKLRIVSTYLKYLLESVNNCYLEVTNFGFPTTSISRKLPLNLKKIKDEGNYLVIISPENHN